MLWRIRCRIICFEAIRSIILKNTDNWSIRLLVFKLFFSKPVFFKIGLITAVFKDVGKIELANESEIISSKYGVQKWISCAATVK